MRNFSIVFNTVFKEAVKTKAYLYMTIGLVALSLLLFASPSIMKVFNTDSTDETYKIVNQTSLKLSEKELTELAGSWTIVDDANIEDLKEDIKADELTGFFVLEDQTNLMQLNIYMPKVNNEVLLPLESYIKEKKVASIVATQSIDMGVLQELNTPLQSNVQSLYETEPNALFIIYGLISIMFFSISIYGNNVATAIASEKSSRVMEVMITKVAPVPMMYGKILGIGLASLTQLFIFMGALLLWANVGIFEVPEGSLVQTVMETITWGTAAYILIFFIIGYFIYATLYAIFGSMVSRPDDLASASLPIMILLMASLAVEMLFVVDSPEGTITNITSYIPFTAPMSVIIRIVYNTISPVEIAVSLLVMISFIALFAAMAARIYPKGVLKSDSLTFKQLIQSNR
ncbi:ABC transporter permease [Lysinibacillus agricola]|uniref:ABC transporter permease n=1 Tax=Lysinibacillus agricola TaxID=2590012 RepID=A0ABX7AT81_9BACI|nr:MULTISPECIES: ABC transporter permease [Lysinibacillus]KOS59777.1 sodium ABC transporter permease [Lysinibacillus sp. FJAT-14222]QQP13004.1 ABC transporter permease [Lysinibacillus agricola]